jgi:hypothetical protein
MQVFLSHASEQKALAETVAFSLRNRGYKVFLDKDDLPPGMSYDEQIEAAVRASDYMVFLVSPAAVAKGRYTLTELEYARRRWGTPHNRVLPVMAEATPMASVPEFLKAVTLLEPKGNAAAEISSAVAQASASRDRRALTTLAIAGLASGLLSAMTINLPGRFNPSLKLIDFDTPLLPGFFFGFALAAALWLILRPPVAALALVFAGVQAGWHTAANTAIKVMNEFKVETASIKGKVGEAPGILSLSFDPGMILPGLVAGLVGALLTWVGVAAASGDLRRPSVAINVSLIGAAAGLVLCLMNFYLLYVAWQGLVATAIGQQLARAHRT